MRLPVADVAVTTYTVEAPEICPECGADLTTKYALKHWEYQDQSRSATMHEGTDLGWESDLPEGGDNYIPLEWYCAACDHRLAGGNESLTPTPREGNRDATTAN